MKNFEIGFIGAGNMASAILNGIISKKILPPEKIMISDIDEKKLATFEKIGVKTTIDNKVLVENSKYIIFAIKPQVAVDVLPEIKKFISGNMFISIMAGINKNKLKNMIGDVAIARVMPNLPSVIGKGMTAIDATDFNQQSKQLVLDIFNSLGEVLEINESYFDAVTAVSGSGPAYVYMFINSMIKGGVANGLSFEDSKMLTLQTFKGAISMVEFAEHPIETLIGNVCSKGGTTIQAINHYHNFNLENIIIEGMNKCKKRSEELSQI